jgi:hypothetical protein
MTITFATPPLIHDGREISIKGSASGYYCYRTKTMGGGLEHLRRVGGSPYFISMTSIYIALLERNCTWN